MSTFDKFRTDAYPHRFHGQIRVKCIAGGTPSDPNVAEAWLRTKLADNDDLIRQQVAEVMVERGIDADEAARYVNNLRHLNGFRRDDKGLYIEGRQLKACLKEAANIAANAGKLPAKGWGRPTDPSYKKGIKGWFPEHVFVPEDRLHLGITSAEFAAELDKNGTARAGIAQRFVRTRHGSGIQYEEYVEDVVIDFTVATDHPFKEKEWAMLWLTAEQQGIGASRSQEYGRFEVTRWEAA